MIKEGKFGIQEAVCLTTITISAKVFFSSPAIIAGRVGTTGWYMTLISASVALCGFLVLTALLKRFPGRDLVEIYELSLGRVVGFVFSGILAMHLLFLCFTGLAEFNEVIRVYVFPLTPNWMIVGLFAVCVLSLGILGLESMARFSRLMFFIMLLGFLLVIALGSQNYDTNNLFPILGHGIDKTLMNGIARSSAYTEVIILAIFARSMQRIEHIKKEGIISLVLSAFYISGSILTFTLTFPYVVAQEITAPMYEMATLIDYSRHLQRVEPIFLFIWIISTLTSISILFYAFVWVYSKMFRLQDQKPIVLGGTVILFFSALMHKDIITIIFGNVQWSRTYGAIVAFGLPIIALLVSMIRKRKGERAHA